MEIMFSDEALEDLKNISDYISNDSPVNAEKFINNVISKIQKYTIVFKIAMETIFILSIFKARRLWRDYCDGDCVALV